MISLALLLSAATVPTTTPFAFRGNWDLPGNCQKALQTSDSRLLVRKDNVVFSELVFTPAEVLESDAGIWTARGKYSEAGEEFDGELSLKLSRDGYNLTYIDARSEEVRLERCRSREGVVR